MRYLLASVALFACCPLRAATDPSYAPAPAWTLPALPVAASGQDNRSPILLVDGQVMLGTDSSAWGFVVIAVMVTSPLCDSYDLFIRLYHLIM